MTETVDDLPMPNAEERVRAICEEAGISTTVSDRRREFDKAMQCLPVKFAMRWCEPGPLGCACLGCANGPEVGAGNLAAKGFTKEDWKSWWARATISPGLSEP